MGRDQRDRMIWVGDMHPEVQTIQAVFGHDDIVARSLDFVRDRTELPNWMNTFPSYSAWWIIIQHDWYMQNGNLDYLHEQKDYLLSLLDQIGDCIQQDGTNTAPNPFLDWPSSENKEGVKAGIHALFTWAITKGKALCEYLGEIAAAERCDHYEQRLRNYQPDHFNSKQAAALLALTQYMNAKEANENVLAVGGSKGFQPFTDITCYKREPRREIYKAA
ncbi:hypothetical protein [Bacillus sp. JCM 19034]|uniref:hypothetical protein n=1 Tax=Bacillus sp. JCM 19034 TaxID=1481928 RepID=UPI001E58F029|nr:hypothetical protein [Bacillus sp. JCM 19034]